MLDWPGIRIHVAGMPTEATFEDVSLVTSIVAPTRKNHLMCLLEWVGQRPFTIVCLKTDREERNRVLRYPCQTRMKTSRIRKPSPGNFALSVSSPDISTLGLVFRLQIPSMSCKMLSLFYIFNPTFSTACLQI